MFRTHTFTDDSSPICNAMHAHGKTVHADDHQFYSDLFPQSVNADTESMEKYITKIRSWMQRMHLKMNDVKAEYILFGTPQQLAKCTDKSIKIGEIDDASDDASDLYFDKLCHHIKAKYRAAYAQQYNISKIDTLFD